MIKHGLLCLLYGAVFRFNYEVYLALIWICMLFMESLSRQASKRQHASLKRSDVIKFIGNFLFDIIIAAPKRTVTPAPARPLSFPSPSPDAVIKGNYLHRHSTEQSKQGVAPNRRSRLAVSLQFSLSLILSIYIYQSVCISICVYLLRLLVPCHCALCVELTRRT